MIHARYFTTLLGLRERNVRENVASVTIHGLCHCRRRVARSLGRSVCQFVKVAYMRFAVSRAVWIERCFRKQFRDAAIRSSLPKVFVQVSKSLTHSLTHSVSYLSIYSTPHDPLLPLRSGSDSCGAFDMQFRHRLAELCCERITGNPGMRFLLLCTSTEARVPVEFQNEHVFLVGCPLHCSSQSAERESHSRLRSISEQILDSKRNELNCV